MVKQDDLLGTQVGDYELSARLATGGMSYVYKALDVKLQRHAAVKILTSDMLEGDESLTERFEREARAIAALEHDHIITIYAFGQKDDLYYLAMRFVDGNDLADELKALRRRSKQMNITYGLNILEQIASALDFAHSKGIIHRDVKPSNILIEKSGKALLTDFGLVLRQSVDKTRGTAFGTPRYISPEQAISSEKAVPQSDVYSLAVILYEMVTGKPVFTGDTPMQVALSHISETPPPPRSINPDIPLPVETEILRALDKEPERRHSTASAFIAAIRQAYGKEIVEDEPTTLLRPPLKSSTPMVQPAPQPTPIFAEADELPEESKQPPPLKSASEDSPDAVPMTPRSRLRSLSISVALIVASGLIVAVVAAGGYLAFGTGNVRLTAGGDGETPIAVAVTDEPTAEPTDEPTVTATAAPEATDPLTATDEPTDPPANDSTGTAEPTATTPPTDKPTATKTVTNEPSETPAPTDEPEPTALPLTGLAVQAPVSVLYTFEALALRNESENDLEVSELSLIRGDGVNFDGQTITASRIPAGECVLLLLQGRRVSVPDEWGCDGQTHSQILLEVGVLFWRATSDADTFEVRFQDTVMTTCSGVIRGGDDVCELIWPLAHED
jgi:serine/threonine-protein kinase